MVSPPRSVTVHALHAGSLTLPERFFITPLDDPNARKTVPSLSFLIQHQRPEATTPTRIVFDLGIRRDVSLYPAPLQKHALTRQPVSGMPDVTSSLAEGGLKPEHVDFVILSHVHWDHVGMPGDFASSKFVVGYGALGLLSGKDKSNVGGHSHFEADLLPEDRTVELMDPTSSERSQRSEVESDGEGYEIFHQRWRPMGPFPSTIDLFRDGSLHLVSAPGHLPGHLNLLCHLSEGRYVYLAGDACHDARLLTGEKEIATWTDEQNPGVVCCIHSDKEAAAKTLEIIREAAGGKTELGSVEVVFAHDAEWEGRATRGGRFFPGEL